MLNKLKLLEDFEVEFGKQNTFYLTVQNTLAAFIAGSHAYRLNRPESDIDLMAVVVPPRGTILGLNSWDKWEPKPEEVKNDLDFKAYSVRKYLHLLRKGNPNVVETLFFDDDVYLFRNTDFQKIRDVKEIFLTQALLRSIKGYANGQLKALEHAKMGKNLGEKRKLAYENFGYDIYAAAHVFRLLLTAIHWLESGEYVPHLDITYRNLIRQVKEGSYRRDSVLKIGKSLFRELNRLETTRHLPDVADFETVNSLLMRINRSAVCL